MDWEHSLSHWTTKASLPCLHTAAWLPGLFSLHIMPILHVHKSSFSRSFWKLISLLVILPWGLFSIKYNTALTKQHWYVPFTWFVYFCNYLLSACINIITLLGHMLFIVLRFDLLQCLAQNTECKRKVKVFLELMTNNIHIYWVIMDLYIIHLL